MYEPLVYAQFWETRYWEGDEEIICRRVVSWSSWKENWHGGAQEAENICPAVSTVSGYQQANFHGRQLFTSTAGLVIVLNWPETVHECYGCRSMPCLCCYSSIACAEFCLFVHVLASYIQKSHRMVFILVLISFFFSFHKMNVLHGMPYITVGLYYLISSSGHVIHQFTPIMLWLDGLYLLFPIQ